MVSNAHQELREWVEAHPSDKIFKVLHLNLLKVNSSVQCTAAEP